MKVVKVVAAIIEVDGKILCLQRLPEARPYASLRYEFPGGKIEPGETPTMTLERELKEELDLDVKVCDADFFLHVDYQYPDFILDLDVYKIVLNECNYTLKVHASGCFLPPAALDTLPWLDADWVIIKRLIS